MSYNFESVVLQEFSADKIIKFLQRFKINISSAELDAILASSYSTKQVTDNLLAKYPTSRIIINNLERYITRYWEITFPEGLFLEKVLYEMHLSFIDRLDSKLLVNQLTKYEEVFQKINFFISDLGSKVDLKQHTEFCMNLRSWLVSYLLLLYNVNLKSARYLEAFEHLENFYKSDLNSIDNQELKSVFDITKIKLSYYSFSKEDASKFLKEFINNYPTNHGILFLKGSFLIMDFKIEDFDEYLSFVTSFLKENYHFFDEYELEQLSILLESIGEKGRQKNNKILNNLIETVKSFQTKYARQNEGKKEKFNDEQDITIQNIHLFPVITISNKLMENNILKNFKKFQYKYTLYEIFEKILLKEIQVTLSFECSNCGVIYSDEFKRIRFPSNLNDLIKNKSNIIDNGTVLFDHEVFCPACSSFKFAIEKYSKLFLNNLLSYTSSQTKEEKYDIKDEKNPIIVVKLELNYVKKPKTLTDSIEQLDKLIQKNPSESKFFKERANQYLYLNDYNEARKDYLKAFDINPKDAEPALGLLKIFQERKQFDQCKKIIYDVISKMSKDGELFMDNFQILKNIQEVVKELKDSKLNRQYQAFLEK